MIRNVCLCLCLWLAQTMLVAQSPKRLSLVEALQTAVEGNLGIKLQQINLESRNISFDLTRAQYEPTVTSTVGKQASENRPTDTTEGDLNSSFSSSNDFWNSTFTKTEDFGLNYSLSFNNSNSNSGSARSFGETFISTISFSINQQLLRGYAFDEEIARKNEFVAKHDVDISKYDLELNIVDVLQQTENAYWDLVAAGERLKVAQESLKLAEQLYEQNRIKIEVGTLAPIELKNTEATVASRERDVVDAENTVRAAEDALKMVMNLPVQEWGTQLVPLDSLKVVEIKADIDTDYQRALENRPENRKDWLEKQKALLELKYSKNQNLPGLVLGADYSTPGVDFSVPNDAAEYANAVRESLNNDFPSYTFRLSLNWTPFNKAAKLNLAQSRLALRQADLNIEQTGINIMQSVRAAIRELDANYKALKANEKTLKYREENLKAEEQKFQNGLSDNYRVAQVQEELSRARADLIQSNVNYLKAVVSYHKALGMLDDEHKISVQ